MNRQLVKIEQDGELLFHGSADDNISEFEPRQAYSVKNGKKEPDDKPAVHATPVLDIACFMALINKKNCPKGFFCKYENSNGKVRLMATQETLNQLKNPSGYVYLLEKKNFSKRNEIEYICYQKVTPIMKIEVRKEDLPDNIEVIEDPLNKKTAS